MRRHILVLCTVMLGIGTLAACAQPAGSVNAGANAPAASTSPTASVAASPSPAASPLPAASPPPTASTSKPITVNPPGQVDSSGGTMTVTGSVVRGAEPSCLLLTMNNVEYLLLAPDSMNMRAGVRAAVTGHVEHGVMTHCQQGQPFEVTSFEALKP
jgi:hypothetical protein